MSPLLALLLTLLPLPTLSRNLVVDYFMTSETKYLTSRCCNSDNTDIIRIYPETTADTGTSLFLNFTVNKGLLKSLRDKSLCSAELRMYQPQHPQHSRTPQRIEALLQTPDGEHVLDSKKVVGHVRGWKNLNVYDAFSEQSDSSTIPDLIKQETVKGLRNKVMVSLEIRPHRLDGSPTLLHSFKSNTHTDLRPRIYLKSCRPNKRRIQPERNPFDRSYSVGPPERFNEPSFWSETQDVGKCGVRLLYLQFEKDMSIPSIRAPQGVYVNYCAGSCPYLWKTEQPPLHTLILGQYAEQMREALYEPCCVPASYEPAEAITVENQIIRFEELRVTSCKCV